MSVSLVSTGSMTEVDEFILEEGYVGRVNIEVTSELNGPPVVTVTVPPVLIGP